MVMLGVTVKVTEGTGVGVSLAVSVGTGVKVAVAVGRGEAVSVGSAVAVSAKEGTGEIVAEGVGVSLAAVVGVSDTAGLVTSATVVLGSIASVGTTTTGGGVPVHAASRINNVMRKNGRFMPPIIAAISKRRTAARGILLGHDVVVELLEIALQIAGGEALMKCGVAQRRTIVEQVDGGDPLQVFFLERFDLFWRALGEKLLVGALTFGKLDSHEVEQLAEAHDRLPRPLDLF
jgi:hypothetical protein